MNLKTVTARSMPEALAQVKRELGPDAVIVQTRTFRQGGWLGIGRRTVVEITARLDDLPVRGSNGQADAAPGQRAVPTILPNLPAGELIRRTYAAARDEQPGQGGSLRKNDDLLAQEVRQVRQMVEKLMQHQPRADAGEVWPGALAQVREDLLEQEVSGDLTDAIMTQVRRQLSSQQQADARQVRQAAATALTAAIRVEPADLPDGPAAVQSAQKTAPTRVMALIGPTGVGKTTTIAKLAAIFKLKRNLKVGLVTLDTYRIAAVDQLRTYADIMGLPLHVVLNPDELGQALKRSSDCDVVLIDTAGRSQRDDPRLEQLREFLDAASPNEVHLVLSATSSQRVMLQAAERFAGVRADRLIFTKLDEAVSYGPLLNIAHQMQTPVSYLTTGQEVPHQIEPARAERIARLLLGES